QRRRRGLAFPPQHDPRLREAAARLRQSRDPAFFQASVALQRARPVALVRPHLRRSFVLSAEPPAADLFRRVRPRPVSDALPAVAVDPLLSAFDSRVEFIVACPARRRGGFRRCLLDRSRALSADPEPLFRQRLESARGAVLSRPAGDSAGRIADLSGTADAHLRALSLARAPAPGNQADRFEWPDPETGNRLARARLLSFLLERAGTGKRNPAPRRDGISFAAQVPDRHGPGLERLGSGNLPGAVGQGAAQNRHGKPHRPEA